MCADTMQGESVEPRKYIEWPILPGTYQLSFEIREPLHLRVGALGAVMLPAGRYAYVGSAHGPGGLRARLGRHLRDAKLPHWHIDYLTAVSTPTDIAYIIASRVECEWVHELLAGGATAPATGFGNGDCRAGCPAHLLRLPEESSGPGPSQELRSEVKHAR